MSLRHPIPAHLRAEIPAAIMIRSPGPGFVAGPVPTGIGALPMPVAVRTPLGFNLAGNPAAAIRANYLPASIRVEWLIKIVLGAYHDVKRADRSVDLHRRWRDVYRWWDVHGRRHVHGGRYIYFLRAVWFRVIMDTWPRLMHVGCASRERHEEASNKPDFTEG